MVLRWDVIGVALLAVVLSAKTAVYAREWRSNLSLWCYAAEITPRKPRPWINCGAAIAQSIKFPIRLKAEMARDVWLEAREIAKSPHVPVWDRVAADRLVERNLTMLGGSGWLGAR